LYQYLIITEVMNLKIKKGLGIATIIAVIVFVLFIFFKFYFVFGEGVKAGELNYFVHKGYVFKTYEGKMIQTGFRSQTAGSIQSYEFPFSVDAMQRKSSGIAL